MIMFNICAALCSSLVYCLLNSRQRQTAGQREKYFPGPFMSLAEASQSWKVYRQCTNKSDRDTHVCNFCGFAIKASPTELPGHANQEQVSDDSRSQDGKVVKRRPNKKGKKGA